MFINFGTEFFFQTSAFRSTDANTYNYVRSFLTSTPMLTTENISETLAFNFEAVDLFREF
jgi:hypothetical protein